MEFTMTVNMDNTAFEAMGALELGSIVHKAIERVAYGDTKGALRDSNGNRVGEWRITA